MKKGLRAALAVGFALIAVQAGLAWNGQSAQAKPAEILFTVQLILGTASDKDKTEESLNSDPVIKEIRSLMTYRNFSLLDTSELRAKDNETVRIILGKQRQYVLTLKAALRRDDKGEAIQTEIRFSYNFPDQKSADLIQSTLPLKPGERTVLGVSKPEGIEPLDQGLILIISGKPVR